MRLLVALAALLLTVPVQAAGLPAPDLAKQIDQQVQARLNADKVPASPLCDDAEFVRRAYLDLTGVIPPADKVAEFLDSKDPAKRTKLIDELLASPNFGRRMADVWLGLLVDRSSDNRRLDFNPFHAWLTEKFNANTPWDKFVSELVTASGPQDKNGAVTYFFSNNTVDKMTDSVTKLFLGVQLQCAQCHNHPFTAWKQQEYWGMAQFFTKVRFNGNANQVAKRGVSPEVTEEGNPRGRGPGLPESAMKVSAKFLQAEEPKMPSGAYRPVLAQWLTAKENAFFARAITNRLWHQMFGRGFVHPVDDMHKDNAPSHPELLAFLAEQLKASDFDIKHLLRAICNSQTYQRTSKPLEANAEDDILLSKMAIKVMTPEQLYDSLEMAIGKSANRQGGRPQQAGRGAPASPRDAFVAFFAGEEGASPTDYQAGVPQALRLMNAALYNNPNNQLLQEVNKLGKPEQAIERLFLGTLSRRPSAGEMQKLLAHVAQAGDAKTGYSDILWAILNSSEFTLNH